MFIIIMIVIGLLKNGASRAAATRPSHGDPLAFK